VAVGLPWFRVARASGVGAVDLDALDQVDTSSMVDHARCFVTDLPANATYEWDAASSALVDGFNVLSGTTVTGRWLLLSISSGARFVTQASWYVDATNGDDANGGTSWDDALQTQPELGRRCSGFFDPSLANVAVYLRGDFAEAVSLQAVFANVAAVMTIQGEMSEAHAGVIGAYLPFDPATDQRASLAETAVDLGPYVGKRVRVTSGAVAGAVSHIATNSGQLALVGQFSRMLSSGSTSTSNPSAGDGFSVEDYLTEIPCFDINIQGAHVVVRDLRIRSTSDANTIRSCMVGSLGALASCNVFGCEFAPDSIANVSGNFTLCSCRNTTGSLVFINFVGRKINHVALAPIYIGDASFVAGFNNIHQGATATLSVGTGSTLEDLGHRGMFAVGGSAAFAVESLGRYFLLHAADLLWGSGNTAGATVAVGGACQVVYLAKPTITGSGTDALVGGVAKSWAEIPYIDIGAGTNNSAAMLVLGQ
jgi:hypothetical protein